MVKVKEVKHSDEDVSSESEQVSKLEDEDLEEDMYGDESGEDMEFISPWEDMAEEGEVEMDDYGEEGEEEYGDEEGEFEEHDMDAIINSNKEMKNVLKELKNFDEAPQGEEDSLVSDEGAQNEQEDDEEGEVEIDGDLSDADLQKMSPEQFKKLKLEKFGQRGINNEDQIKQRLHEIKQNFYNRLESKKLIKKQGKIPFGEHMTLTNPNSASLGDNAQSLQINNDIKREVIFYNNTRENVMKAMQILIQSKVPISRPDDFFAEMIKSDAHMAKVKGRLLKQQSKIQKFEEKKSKMENRKFHKAMKQFTQEKRHKEKRENLEAIKTLKEKINKQGGDIDDKDFNKIMLQKGSKMGMDPQKGKRTEERTKVLDQIKQFPRAKKGEDGRVGKGRFNRDYAIKKASGEKWKPNHKSKKIAKK